MLKKDKIKIIIRKLGKERCVGQAYQGENLIEIDPRQNSKDFLGTAIHESLHILYPDLTEEEIIHAEEIMSDVIWRLNYRRIAS
jgi:hypothetical protein